MNAPAAISDPKVAAFAAQVINYLPSCHGRELEARCRLLMARDTAALAMTNCSEIEAGLIQEIHRLGVLYAYAALPEAALQNLLKAQRHMLRAAGFLSDFADAADRGDARV